MCAQSFPFKGHLWVYGSSELTAKHLTLHLRESRIGISLAQIAPLVASPSPD